MENDNTNPDNWFLNSPSVPRDDVPAEENLKFSDVPADQRSMKKSSEELRRELEASIDLFCLSQRLKCGDRRADAARIRDKANEFLDVIKHELEEEDIGEHDSNGRG